MIGCFARQPSLDHFFSIDGAARSHCDCDSGPFLHAPQHSSEKLAHMTLLPSLLGRVIPTSS